MPCLSSLLFFSQHLTPQKPLSALPPQVLTRSVKASNILSLGWAAQWLTLVGQAIILHPNLRILETNDRYNKNGWRIGPYPRHWSWRWRPSSRTVDWDTAWQSQNLRRPFEIPFLFFSCILYPPQRVTSSKQPSVSIADLSPNADSTTLPA